jgi:hypothetical protein
MASKNQKTCAQMSMKNELQGGAITRADSLMGTSRAQGQLL